MNPFRNLLGFLTCHNTLFQILAVRKSNKCVNIFTKKKNRAHYILKKFCSGQCPTVTTFLTYICPLIADTQFKTFLTYICPLIADTQFKTVWTEGIDSSSSRQPHNTEQSTWHTRMEHEDIPNLHSSQSEVPPLQMTSSKQVSEIPYINLNESFEELSWVFNMP